MSPKVQDSELVHSSIQYLFIKITIIIIIRSNVIIDDYWLKK